MNDTSVAHDQRTVWKRLSCERRVDALQTTLKKKKNKPIYRNRLSTVHTHTRCVTHIRLLIPGHRGCKRSRVRAFFSHPHDDLLRSSLLLWHANPFTGGGSPLATYIYYTRKGSGIEAAAQCIAKDRVQQTGPVRLCCTKSRDVRGEAHFFPFQSERVLFTVRNVLPVLLFLTDKTWNVDKTWNF